MKLKLRCYVADKHNEISYPSFESFSKNRRTCLCSFEISHWGERQMEDKIGKQRSLELFKGKS